MTASTREPNRELPAGRVPRAVAAALKLALVLSVAVLLLPSAAAADLVVLVNGEVFKVDRYEATEEEATLWLPQGGRLILPIAGCMSGVSGPTACAGSLVSMKSDAAHWPGRLSPSIR